jgi:hypothetical protein
MAYKANLSAPDVVLKTTTATQEAEVSSQKAEFL